MATMESVCARLCLLTRYAWKKDMPAPLPRASVRRMLRLGALEGLALRNVPGIPEEQYDRARSLLSRASEVYAGMESQISRGFRIMLPEDAPWPVNLHALGAHMPQFLFVKGNRALLNRRCVAVAGSRSIAPQTMEMARGCGQQIAGAGMTLVTGGADGVDTMAQFGALERGGNLVLVPAMPANQFMERADLAKALSQGRFLLLCDTWPDEPFSTQKAISRNHTIYALGDAALVLASRNGVGGSWDGARHCLRGGYTPLFAAEGQGCDFEGNRALIDQGAKAFDPARPLSSQLFGEEGAAHD